MLEEGLSPPATTTTAPGAIGGRKAHQVHRRESSKWIPREPPISQRIIQPIRERRERVNANSRLIEPNWRFPNLPRWKLKNYQKFCSNKITTTKYHIYNFIFKNLWEQFHRWANPYFIFIAGMNWIPALQAFSKVLGLVPVTIILALTAMKDAFEDYRRHLADKKINSQTPHVWSSEKNRCRKMPWEHIIVGDYIHVSIDETIPADLLLIRSSDPQGCVFVETSNLDGESNLKLRSVMPKCRTLCDETGDFDPSPLNIKVFCNPPNKVLDFIQGYVQYGKDGEEDRITKDNIIIRGCKLRNTTFIEGIVLYTGKETKAMLNNGEIKMKQSSLEKQTNIFVIFCVLLLIFMCFSGGGLSISWLVRHAAHEVINGIPYVVLYTTSAVGDGFINMATFIISYQILIPLSLYITVELIKLGQLYFLNHDLEMYDEMTDKRILCRSFTIAEELGQIQYILSDKTGTLTENKMVFKYCAINGRSYEPSLMSPMSENSFANRSVDEDEPVEVNEALRQALPRVADDHSESQASAVYYFFLNLAICNTVMVANQKYDQINNGYMEGEAFRISNSLFYLRPNDYPPTEPSTPAGRSGRSTNIQTPSSSRLVSILNPADIVRRLSSLNISSLFRKEEKIKLKSKKQLKIYEAESPDEYCLVNAAKSYGFNLAGRDLTHVSVNLPTQREYPHQRRLKLRVEKVLKFDSNRKRMSIILDMGDNRKLLLCKGADDEILANLCQKTLEQNLEAKKVVESSKVFLKQYSRNGLRTLCMAMKTMSNEEYNRWEVQHEVVSFIRFKNICNNIFN
jgi:phospholipid-translocating ATPase